MKKLILLLLLVPILSGCQDVKFWGSHTISTWTGLHRKIIIASPFTGQEITSYETKSKVDYAENKLSFFDGNNKRIDVFGNVIVIMQEK